MSFRRDITSPDKTFPVPELRAALGLAIKSFAADPIHGPNNTLIFTHVVDALPADGEIPYHRLEMAVYRGMDAAGMPREEAEPEEQAEENPLPKKSSAIQARIGVVSLCDARK